MAAIFVYSLTHGEETEHYKIKQPIRQKSPLFLHQKKPEPIIHRDVSSANVLLWRQGEEWRGKVSDYGTANFIQQTMTVAPGAVRVKGGMSLWNGMWHGLRNYIIMRNVKYGKWRKEIN